MTDAVLSIRHGAVQVLVMNNPAARKAITAELYASLPAALADAQGDPRIGAIVLTERMAELGAAAYKQDLPVWERLIKQSGAKLE